MLGEDLAHADLLMRVDYKKSAEEVFTDAARLLPENSKDLALLSTISEEAQPRNQILPSWVPDFSVHGFRPNLLFGFGPMVGECKNKSFFSTSGQLPRSLRLPLSGHALRLDGHIFDAISAVGESDDERINDPVHSFLHMLKLVASLKPIYHMGEKRSDVFWRTMIADQSGDDHPASSSLSIPFKKACPGWLLRMVGHICLRNHPFHI